MALPTVFQTFDLESPHFGPAQREASLRTCLGHLNRVTRSTYREHLDQINRVTDCPSPLFPDVGDAKAP